MNHQYNIQWTQYNIDHSNSSSLTWPYKITALAVQLAIYTYILITPGWRFQPVHELAHTSHSHWHDDQSSMLYRRLTARRRRPRDGECTRPHVITSSRHVVTETTNSHITANMWLISNAKMNNSSATRYSEYLQLHESYNKTTNVWQCPRNNSNTPVP